MSNAIDILKKSSLFGCDRAFRLIKKVAKFFTKENWLIKFAAKFHATPIICTKQDMIEVLNTLLSLPSETEVVEFKEANNRFDKDKLGRRKVLENI